MGYIKDVQIGNETHLVEPILYGICNTEANVAQKTANIPNFVLVEGVEIKIKFVNENSAATPTLNITKTGDKTIYLNNGNISPWTANEVVTLIYDGEKWILPNYGKIEVIRL